MSASTTASSATARYARVIEVSRRVRWEIERDVIRGRRFDYSRTFMPAGLSLVNELDFLTTADKRLLSQVQGRTYAYMFGLVERFIGAKVIELSSDYGLGDQVALEALVRMTDEELKHQELFRRLEDMMAADMPPGYVQTADGNAVAQLVLSKSNWAVLALTLDIELFSQAHYKASIEPQDNLSELWKDVFLFHWKEEAQHAILDELELVKEDAKLTTEQRSAAVDELIELVGAVNGMVQGQAEADARYFMQISGRTFSSVQQQQLDALFLKAYRWQYIISGAMEPRFQKVLFGLVDQEQGVRIQNALAPLTYAVPNQPEMPLPLAA